MAELLRELRSASLVDTATSGRTIRGYAAVFDTPWNERMTEEMGYVETVARGAFRKALPNSGNVPLLWQHERRDMLATLRGGTLRLKEDGRGLAFEADLPNTQLGNDVLEHIKRGDVQGMSYGILSAPEDSSLSRANGHYQRTINNVRRLLDVTLTYEPTYEEATVELRSMGFVALPLQELVSGVEAQTDQAATEVPSLETSDYLAREREVRIDILEKGGIL